MNTWYFPSWTGDFRLLEVNESSYRDTASAKACVLQIVDPTEDERVTLLKFLEQAQANGWTAIAKLSAEPRQEILLNTSVNEAGKLFITFTKMADRTITAIKSENGKMTVLDTAELLAQEPEIIATADVPAEPSKKKKEKTKAVSVQRPTPSCPQCVPGAISRASEVLLSFLTPEEHKTWASDRYIVVQGGITGHDYLIAHRHSQIAIKIGRICFDLDDEAVIHFHDNSVPPEEEVLAAKLILQHREPWLRNEATVFGRVHDAIADSGLSGDGEMFPGPRVTEYDDSTGEVLSSYQLAPFTMYCKNGMSPFRFKNPFGNTGDGVPDAETTQAVGSFLNGFFSVASVLK